LSILSENKGNVTAARTNALKFIVHFIGDIHQPLHASDHHDRGGNQVVVTWFGATNEPPPFSSPWELHAVWDAGLIDHKGQTRAEYVKDLETWIATQNVTAIEAGTVTDWVLEAHALAKSTAYQDPQTNSMVQSGAALDQPYYQANIGVVDQQLAKAGVRLAKVLNDTFP
jgi:nuclease S1